MKHIVLIGGGSWISHLLTAFSSENDWKISAIIATGDSGWSSGVIRKSYDVPALGDIVKNLAALGGADAKWLRYRYRDGFLAGHTAGNVWLLGLIESYGFESGIKKAHTLLGYTKHSIIPVTSEVHDIVVRKKNNEIIVGEGPIVQTQDLAHNVAGISLTPRVSASADARAKILEADCIIIWPGTLYTSLIACLVPDGIIDAIKQSSAQKIYIANAANFPPGHCDGYTLEDYVSEIQNHTGISDFDHILAHDGTGIDTTLRIPVNRENNVEQMDVLTTPAHDIDGIYDSIKRNTLRHDGEKVARWIKKIFD